MSNLIKCSNCGGLNPLNSKFCSFCGAEMIQETPSSPSKSQSTRIDEQSKNQYTSPTQNLKSDHIPSRKTKSSTNSPSQERIIAIILAFLFGYIGVHHFYLGNTSKGIIFLCFSWTGIPYIIALIEAIVYLTESNEDFHHNHVSH